jgi:hypothetical protein
LSGSLRSTLDVFDEYDDAEIVRIIFQTLLFLCSRRLEFEALRRVHLIPSHDTPEETANIVNANAFRNLDSSVSEGGENFSTGYVGTSIM